MKNNLLEKWKEAAQSVLPVSAIVLFLHVTISPLPLWTFILFLVGTVLTILGMSIFTLGAELSMMPIGEAIGSELTKSRKLWLIIAGGFALGLIVTLAEPDLQVLTKQVPAVPDLVLVVTVSVGVGLFLVLALLRILFQFPLSIMFGISYALVFLVAAFTAPDFLAVGFDSGGVTTGPVTVPFILALGAGISAVRGGRNAEEDSFGLCALCSIGPVLAVLIMGMFFDVSASGYAFTTPETVNGWGELVRLYGSGLYSFFREVAAVLLPIVVIFMFFQIVRLKLSKTTLFRILFGILYTLIGLTVFLTGVNLGFMPIGKLIGKTIASMPNNWLLYPLSAVLGFFVVYAEPAVHVLTHQVEEITSGAITRRMMLTGLAIGVSMALLLSVLRLMTGISIWWFLAPGYVVGLLLTIVTPKIFTAIAFDSGGVAAGTMTAAFLLPFAVGICDAVGGNIMTDAFGIVAMVAMMPLITIQIIGILYQWKLKRNERLEQALEAQAMEEEEVFIPLTEDVEMLPLETKDEAALSEEQVPLPDIETSETKIQNNGVLHQDAQHATMPEEEPDAMEPRDSLPRCGETQCGPTQEESAEHMVAGKPAASQDVHLSKEE